MPDNFSQQLTDLLVRRDIDLLRVAESDAVAFEDAIDSLTAELVRRLIRKNSGRSGIIVSAGFVDEYAREIRAIVRDIYSDLYRTQRQAFLDVMVAESEFISNAASSILGTNQSTTNKLIGTNIGRSARNDIIDTRSITANANDAATMREFFEREAASHHRRHVGALRQAFAQDETITQMLKRFDDVSRMQGKDAVAIIRTGYNHVVSQLRIEVMQRNAHLFQGVVAIAILDTRTSLICISRSGGKWDLNTGRPLEDSPVQYRFPGPTPWHMSCRTQLYPITRNADDVANFGTEDVKEAIASLTDEQKTLLNTDPPQEENYEQWLRRQSAEIQNQVLGPSRRKLWLDGRLPITGLITQKGRPLTLKELNRKYKAA